MQLADTNTGTLLHVRVDLRPLLVYPFTMQLVSYTHSQPGPVVTRLLPKQAVPAGFGLPQTKEPQRDVAVNVVPE